MAAQTYKELLFILLLTFVLSPRSSDAVGNLTSSPKIINGVLTVCPGGSISITCNHNVSGAADLTLWEVDGGVCAVLHAPNSASTCGPFTFTDISDGSGSEHSSTARLSRVTDNSLDGVRVICRAGGIEVVGNITIRANVNLTAIPTPTIESVMETSQTEMRVEMSIPANSSTCAANYQVTATQHSGSGSSQGNSSNSTVFIRGVDVCTSSYNLVGTVLSPGGVAGEMSPTFSFTADLPGVNGVHNVMAAMDRTVLIFEQLPNPDYPSCITGYRVLYPGGSYDTPSPTTSVTRETLEQNGFSFCQLVDVTVTPLTPKGPLIGGASTGQVSLIIPGFISPLITGGFTLHSSFIDNIYFTGIVQSVSESIVMKHRYGVSRNEMTCTPDQLFTGESFSIALPSAAPGDVLTVCVSFMNGDCISTSSAELTVPGLGISISNPLPGETIFYSTVHLPISAYLPGQLLLLISVAPNDIATVEAPFPTDYQYTLSLTGLTPETEYTYTVEIVRISDRASIQNISDRFTTLSLGTSNLSYEVSITVAVLITFALSLLLGVLFGGLFVYICIRKRTIKQTPADTEMRVYDELDLSNVDPTPKQNIAYGQIIR